MNQVNVPDIKSRAIQPPTEKTGEYLPLLPGQTVCTVKNEKGEKCTGHVKQWFTASPEALKKAAPGNTLHRCQRCYAIYEGPPQQYLHPQKKK
ncbi:MAG TPA: hypothetical protein VNO70_10500 [Blastocatellia bacterium]|nr:hypothetical protein [Blastocatellia bacterium]